MVVGGGDVKSMTLPSNCGFCRFSNPVTEFVTKTPGIQIKLGSILIDVMLLPATVSSVLLSAHLQGVVFAERSWGHRPRACPGDELQSLSPPSKTPWPAQLVALSSEFGVDAVGEP